MSFIDENLSSLGVHTSSKLETFVMIRFLNLVVPPKVQSLVCFNFCYEKISPCCCEWNDAAIIAITPHSLLSVFHLDLCNEVGSVDQSHLLPMLYRWEPSSLAQRFSAASVNYLKTSFDCIRGIGVPLHTTFISSVNSREAAFSGSLFVLRIVQLYCVIVWSHRTWERTFGIWRGFTPL